MRTGSEVIQLNGRTVIHLSDRKRRVDPDMRCASPAVGNTTPSRLRSWSVGTGLVVAAVLGASAATAQTPAVPSALARALAAAYPGWRLAATTGVPNAGQWVRGDFDGNGRADYAIQIVRSAQEAAITDDQRQIVVVAWSRPGDRSQGFDFTVVRAEPVSDVMHLALARRGQRVPDLDADENGTRTYRLAHDGIHILYGEVAGTTCQLMPKIRPRRFECRTSGD
jgi:hypothetical protein